MPNAKSRTEAANISAMIGLPQNRIRIGFRVFTVGVPRPTTLGREEYLSFQARV